MDLESIKRKLIDNEDESVAGLYQVRLVNSVTNKTTDFNKR